MDSMMMAESRAAGGTAEHRRAARMRRVRPVAFVPRNVDAAPSLQTVTANVSRGGMLLVTRQDHFPPAGAAVLLMPFEVSAGSAADANAAIQGRIVYTRFSPKARLRFAGLKFEEDLPERAARMLGLDGAPDAVADAVTTLEELESNAGRGLAAIGPILRPAAPVMEAGYAAPRGSVAGRDLSAEFAGAQREFILATAAFLGEWGEGRIRRSIGERHALARAKGIVGLRAMKADLDQARRSFSVLVEVEIGRSMETGRDEATESNPYYNLRLDQPPAKLMESLRDLAGHVGRVLIQHGLEDAGANGEWTPITEERGRVSFRGPLSISALMRESLLRMSALHADSAKAAEVAVAERESHARDEALRLWERA